MVEGKAQIDLEVCYGCAECLTTCKFDAIENKGEGSTQKLQENG